MNEKTQTQLISDVAFIRGKVACLPEVRRQVNKNSQAIARIKGILAVLSVIIVVAAPIAGKFFWGK